MLSLIITTYNRPEYLQQCLESVKAADLSQVGSVMIVDDCSNDKQARRLIDDFELEGVELIKAFSKENKSIKGSLLFGLDVLFNTADVVINLDADAIVTHDAFNRLIELHKNFPRQIATGFNCSTKNRDGSIRHKILEQGEGYNLKYSVGGINMIFSKYVYLEIIRPALLKSIRERLNWDHQACIISNEGYDLPVVVLEPSCVQHIGIGESSMGHMAGGEPPDVADDFKMEEKKDYGTRLYHNGPPITKAKLHIPSVTLIAVDDNIDRIIKAADISCNFIEFGAVKLLSSQDSNDKRAIKIRNLGSKKEYSQFVLKELAAFVETPFALIIQHDGYVLNFAAWLDEFLNYDMVGAVWDFRDHNRTANGGFSLRSKKMLDAIAADDNIYLQNDDIISNFAEDHVLFYIYRQYLEKMHGVKIAPESICNKFSIEAWGKKDNRYKGSFGFHGYGLDFSQYSLHHKPY